METRAPLRVIGFESRRAAEMASLVRSYGGDPFIAPSVQAIALDERAEALELVRRLRAGEIDVVVLTTGVGARALIEAVAPVSTPGELAALLGKAALVARGPKPVAVLRELGLSATVVVPEPHTWRELLGALDRELPVGGKRVAVQEYGTANPELLAGLGERGAEVLRVPLYRWTLPDDLGPLEEAIRRIERAALEVALFTSAAQVAHLTRVAGGLGCRDALPAGLSSAVVASIGPVCSEALRANGLPVDLEPRRPRMGQLVAEALRAAPDLLTARRA